MEIYVVALSQRRGIKEVTEWMSSDEFMNDVPTYFLYPISLEIMKDPVKVSTGITYDRECIEKWLFSKNNKTCPITKQLLSDYTHLTPNHTLRRLIQAWCTLNASQGIQRIPTPKPPINKTQITKLIKQASQSNLTIQIKCLKTLRSFASGSETNKRFMEDAGVVDFLASTVVNNSCNIDSASLLLSETNVNMVDEALSILHNLHVSEAGLKNLLAFKNGQFIESLTKVLQKGFFESRAYAVFLLKSMTEVAEPVHLLHQKTDLFVELVQVLKDQISQKVSKAALQTLIILCPCGRNRIKGVEAGTVSVLIELLLENCKDRKPNEMMLVLLECLCQCAEGRAELLRHGAGMAVVSAIRDEINDVEIIYKPLSDMLECVGEADVVFTSTASENPLILKQHVKELPFASEEMGRKRLFVDIFVPRNVGSCVDDLESVKVYNVDNLKEVVAANKEDKLRKAMEAQVIIGEESGQFEAWRDSLETVPTIKKLRAYAERLRIAEVEKCLGKMSDEDINKKTQKAVDDLGRGIVNKMLHGPMQHLRCDGSDSRTLSETLENMHALNRMFGLETEVSVLEQKIRAKVEQKP
ncbi:unnamed protein product [Vicia faba]|uniref:RING-type E3 ubiquitin transferase n=1 Tax=Vicia faba TaxID=3906 RepID=A0AAV1ASQ4_VICFA|nr:unnamed protein product [Vicia faba]